MNANLKSSTFVQVDFTKIKNKSLAGADLFLASFAYSNLSGVNLTDVILQSTNFWNADLIDQDFMVVSNAPIEGVAFIEANLSNSNFEGVNMSPQILYSTVYENKAKLKILSDKDLIENLFDEHELVHIVSTEVRGNDLVVSFVFFNSFAHANLENANFKNADLRQVDFYSTTLTNADLSGADLRMAYLDHANLSGANLSEVIIDETTILNCIGHPICG